MGNEVDIGTACVRARGGGALPQKLVLRANGKVRSSTVDVAESEAGEVCAVAVVDDRSGRCVCGCKGEARGAVRVGEVDVVVAGGGAGPDRCFLGQRQVVGEDTGGLLERRVLEDWKKRYVSMGLEFEMSAMDKTYPIR